MQKNTKQMGKTKNFDFTLEPGKMKSSRISMNKGTSLITVITICSLNSSYNYVVQMMNSLINQTFPYWEWIIVINDNKSDIINLKYIDKRIKIIVYDYETIAKAKIEAIKNSSTELIFNFEENDLLNERVVLNVNFPANAKGIKITHQAKSTYKTYYIKKEDNLYYTMCDTTTPLNDEPNGDIQAIKNGYISISPLGINYTNLEVYNKKTNI